MNFIIGYILGGLTVWVVYKFNLAPWLRAERTKLGDAITSKLEKKTPPAP